MTIVGVFQLVANRRASSLSTLRTRKSLKRCHCGSISGSRDDKPTKLDVRDKMMRNHGFGSTPLIKETICDFWRSPLFTSATRPTRSYTTIECGGRVFCEIRSVSPSRQSSLPCSTMIPIFSGSQPGIDHICLASVCLFRAVLIVNTGGTCCTTSQLWTIWYLRHRSHHMRWLFLPSKLS